MNRSSAQRALGSGGVGRLLSSGLRCPQLPLHVSRPPPLVYKRLPSLVKPLFYLDTGVPHVWCSGVGAREVGFEKHPPPFRKHPLPRRYLLSSLEPGVPHKRRWGVGGGEVVVFGVKMSPVGVEVCRPARTLAHRRPVAALRWREGQTRQAMASTIDDDKQDTGAARVTMGMEVQDGCELSCEEPHNG